MYTLPELPYEYNALAPIISADIMELHHAKHHQTYVDKLNAALEQVPDLKGTSLVQLLSDIDAIPDSVRTVIRNHGGGHYNHSLCWQCMTPESPTQPERELAQAVAEKWGSLDSFKEEFEAKAVGLFGSGWVWLTRDLELLALPNQDTPMMLDKGEPLMGLDVWEHAYYLDYLNVKADYVKAFWNIANWADVAERFAKVSTD